MRIAHPTSAGLVGGLVVLALVVAVATAADPASRKQLRNLADPPDGPRFEVTPRVWPAEHGEAHLCLWADDKLAAVSFGVDDNIVPEHEWWLEMGRKYDFRCTWFVIVYPMIFEYDGSPGRQGFFGTLDDFRKLYEAGHEVQVHGTTAINSLPRDEYEKDVRMTQEVLQRIDGNPAIVYAYPGGDAGGFKRDVIAETMVGARGTIGGVNPANRTDYLNLRTGQVTGDTLAAMLDDPSSPHYRGWLSKFTHAIGTSKDPATRKAMFDSMENAFKLVDGRRDDLWVTTYREGLLYAQSRDTARLEPGTVTEDEIRFTLSDDMDDELYTYPLTVKVRVADSWNAAEARQAGEPRDATFLWHDGAKYLLVDAVPDAGEVAVSRTEPAACLPPVVLTDPGRYRDRAEIRLAAPTTESQIHYTLDGSEPTTDSPRYDGPITVAEDRTIDLRAASYREGLDPSATVAAAYEVWVDTVAPQVVAADAVAGTGYVALSFSEKLDAATAGEAGNYTVEGLAVNKARLLGDGRTVILDTAAVPAGGALSMTIRGVADPSGNAVATGGPVVIAPVERSAADGLVAHLRFAESDGATYALDGCGSTAPALVEGAPGRQDGEHGPAFVFDGKTSITTPATDYGLNQSNAFTVALWVRFDEVIRGTLVRKGRYAMPFSLSGYASRNAIQAYARVGQSIKRNLPGPVEPGAWRHVAITAAGDTVTMYLDGEAVVTETTDVRVKCPREPMSVGGGLAGRLADLRVYDRALSPEEVGQLAGR